MRDTMTKEDLLNSRDGIPPMGNKTRNPRAHSEKLPASELTGTKIANYFENLEFREEYQLSKLIGD